MKKILFFLSLMIFIISESNAQSTDSLVYVNDISFKNDSDKHAFLNLINKKNEMALLEFFLISLEQKSAENCNNITLTIDNFTDKLNKKINGKNEEEKIQYLREAVDEKFLKIYQLNSSFSALFETGTYDCITANSLYAIFLSKLNIPYQLKEDKNSIYIIAYPQSKKIIIQNADSAKSFAQFNEYFMGKYTKSLFYGKIIPQEEFNKANSEKLFEKYYFCTQAITLLQLASIKYNSKAMIALDNKKKQEAFDDGLKSYFLDSSLRNETTLKYHLFNALGNNNYNDKYDVDKLEFLCRLNNRRDAEVNNEFIISEYKTLLNTVLIKNGDADTFEKYHKLLVQNIDVLSLKQEIEFKYHIEIARIGLNQWKEKKVELYHIKSAFNIKPDDKDIKSIVTETLNISISENRDSETVLKLVDEFSIAFPFLKKSTSVLRIKAHCLLDLAYKNFNNGLIKEGEDFIAKNEDLCKENNLSLDTEIVERGYLSAAKYYFNSGNRIKAKEYLNKGIRLAPESIKIKDKLQIVN